MNMPLSGIRCEADKLFENQPVMIQPIVRNGKQATVGYQPDVKENVIDDDSYLWYIYNNFIQPKVIILIKNGSTKSNGGEFRI